MMPSRSGKVLRRVSGPAVACLLLMVYSIFWWRINFINKHPRWYMDWGMPPIWDYHYWPVVGNDDVRPGRYPRMLPSSGVSWPMTNDSNGAVIVTKKPL